MNSDKDIAKTVAPLTSGVLSEFNRGRGRGLLKRPGQRVTSGHDWKSKEYKSWCCMKDRCFNPKHDNYKYYGAMGITICQEWMDFQKFLADMGRAPSPSHSLDRIDPNGNYEPSNCRWATRVEQGRNKRRHHWMTLNGRTMLSVDWAREVGIAIGTIYARLRSGWTDEQALTISTSPNGRRRKVNA